MTKYSLNTDGSFIIENYNQSKAFSNFFPGIAGLWGIPMWVFYVNRGQCIASFGIESKDKSILEFQAANKAYRLTPTQGFRTFIKGKSGSKKFYWEPFQAALPGSDFRKKQTMAITAHDLTIEEINLDLGLSVKVNYFTLPEEPIAGLVRRVTIENIGKKPCELEVIDGMPVIVPYGFGDWLIKHIPRTVEAWVKVINLDKKAPYFQLNVEVSDKPEVKHIDEGNFYFSFDPDGKTNNLLDQVVEASVVFGQDLSFISPQNFLNDKFSIPKIQSTDNRTPCALSYKKIKLAPGKSKEIISFAGYAREVDQLNKIVKQVANKAYIEKKSTRNKAIIDEIKNYAFTNSSSRELNLYAGHTFLDNILRGGLPISLKTTEGNVSFNVYSRKHGDLERDYNHFVVAPTVYSQGNGNYRDVNQNRRNDVWFNPDVKENHIVSFFNLVQADGYNPLVVKGTTFTLDAHVDVGELLRSLIADDKSNQLKDFLKNSFLPGNLLEFVDKKKIKLKVSPQVFLGKILEVCHKQESAEHGEGFWADHWTYNLDLVESYLGIYPENLAEILLEKKIFSFFHNSHFVLPRDQKFILTDRGVRQYHSVKSDPKATRAIETGHVLRTNQGGGDVYKTHLLGKFLCLLVNKAATLDPSGVGIEMEAEKPNWYDALNGLPGLMGSSVSETAEVKRFSQFLLNALNTLKLQNDAKISLFEELVSFLQGLTNILRLENDALNYWQKSNDLKEHYRQTIRCGINGKEKEISVGEIKEFLKLVIARMEKAVEGAQNSKGEYVTYFYHDVAEYEILDKSKQEAQPLVRPLKFKRHDLPLFLEGFVHILRDATPQKADQVYRAVHKSSLFDKKLKMYKVNTDLSKESEEIGRTRVFPSGWLENESIWLHMEYKFVLELLRNGLYQDYYENFRNILVPFLAPEVYGRNILENSSFIVSSAHRDSNLHGQGFVARLSGSTAEFLHMWLWMNVGAKPFSINSKNELVLEFKPILQGSMFTKEQTVREFYDSRLGNYKKITLPANSYSFNFLGSTLVVYHNLKRRDTFGSTAPAIKEILLKYPNKTQPIRLTSGVIPSPYAQDVRDRKLEQIDVYFQ